MSLPVWRQRYETYGVWIVTQIAGSLNGHELVTHSGRQAEVRFRHGQNSRCHHDAADAQPVCRAARGSGDPVGKSRTAAVQPDFSMWSGEDPFSDCVLVVEVKHYKKRARRNFEEARTDYARAHPRAKVVLVNYGPVGDAFDTLPREIAERCVVIGPLTPETYATRADFRKLVSELVGPPVPVTNNTGEAVADRIIALDVSGPMRTYLASAEFATMLEQARAGNATFAMIDKGCAPS